VEPLGRTFSASREYTAVQILPSLNDLSSDVSSWHIAAIVSADFGWAGSGLERAAEEAGSQNEPKIAKRYSLRNVSVDLPHQVGSCTHRGVRRVITHTGGSKLPNTVSFDGCHCYFLMVVFGGISITQCHVISKSQIQQRIALWSL
jgi:hypothetical protein